MYVRVSVERGESGDMHKYICTAIHLYSYTAIHLYSYMGLTVLTSIVPVESRIVCNKKSHRNRC